MARPKANRIGDRAEKACSALLRLDDAERKVNVHDCEHTRSEIRL